MAKYLAYRCGKGNHDFWLTNENYEMLFKGERVKFRLFGANDYEFFDVETGNKKVHKIGNVVTKQTGFGGVSVTTASYFKYDGVNVFDYLRGKGYSFKMSKVHLMNPEVSLLDNSGNTVATYKLNVKGPKQSNVSGLGNHQMNTEITTESSDLETIFLGAFVLSRVDYSAQMM